MNKEEVKSEEKPIKESPVKIRRREEFNKGIQEALQHDYTKVYDFCMLDSHLSQQVLTKYATLAWVSRGILIAQLMKQDKKAVQALLKIQRKMLTDGVELYPLKDIPKAVMGYVWGVQGTTYWYCDKYIYNQGMERGEKLR